MATSTIKIYYNVSSWRLYPNKLFIVEDIESYLANFSTVTTISTAQYIKQGALEIGVNLELNQYNSQDLASSPIYVSIRNSGDITRTYYYFVREHVWRSKTCVRLELVMDVLNTYKENTDYYFKSNCNILREHKDRFLLKNLHFSADISSVSSSVGSLGEDDTITLKYYDQESASFKNLATCKILYLDNESTELLIISSSYETQELTDKIDTEIEAGSLFNIYKDNSNYAELYFYIDSQSYDIDLYRNIDYVPENINPLLQCGSTAGNLIQNNKSVLACDWYLLYRNQNDPSESLVNPVNCYLIPSEEINTNAAYIQNGRIIPSFIEEGKIYIFRVGSGESFTLSNGASASYGGLNHYNRLIISKAGNKLSAMFIDVYDPGTATLSVEWQYNDLSYITANSLPSYYAIEDEDYVITTSIRYLSLDNEFNNSGTEKVLDSVDKVDRTDAKNIKLIKLPYVPYNFSVSGTTLQIASDTNWEYVSLTQAGGGVINCLHLIDNNLKLNCNIVNDTYNPLANLMPYTLAQLNPSPNNTRRSVDVWGELESKMFNSEFYAATYVYDSFSFKVELEKVNIDDSPITHFDIKFDMTSTINSKFMFTFKDYYLRIGDVNYAKVLPIARNNEEVLYNVPYINYIRTGFNYDVKQRNISNVSNYIGLGLSAASIGASLLMPSVPLKVAGVVAAVVGFASQIKSTITTALNSENTLKQKITQSQNQTSSVSGSDDVDLMSVYAENRLKYLVYEPRPEMKNLIRDLFFYCGQAATEMKKPTHNNRINFDYLQAEVSFTNEGAINQECLNELVNCFKNGVTYIHKNTSRSGVARWDMDQTYENWETKLFN